jgi:hypothetical protein
MLQIDDIVTKMLQFCVARRNFTSLNEWERKMALGITVAALALMQTSVATTDTVDVAFDAMAAQHNDVAIETIEANPALDPNDPARLINLGVAYAREGRVALARELLTTAAQTETRYRLETASGEWVDSRWLAMRALAALDKGELRNSLRVAKR